MTLYDSVGNTTILEVDTVGPEYPIAVIGINESLSYMETMIGDSAGTFIGKISTGSDIKITKIDIDLHPKHYEPWYAGKADIYFVYYEYNVFENMLTAIGANPSGISIPEEEWNLAIGERTNYVKYKCWRCRRKWWGCRYVSDTPERTINKNTGWNPSGFDFQRNYKFRVIEYDFPFYDRGSDFWCSLFGVSVSGVSGGNLIGITLGYVGYKACDLLVFNDDPIGDKNGFEDIVEAAAQNPGTEYQWTRNTWKIKLKIE